MIERMKNLLPNDQYIIRLNKSPHEDYVMALTHLYQPLIGMRAITIYLTLLNEAKILQDVTTHHHLMNITNIDLDQFYDARSKLEGIGLLRTYVEDTDVRIFHYKLIPPFSTQQFFEDSMLSILLEHHLGEKQYFNLKNTFVHPSIPAHATDKTKSFDEVFSTILPSYSKEKEPTQITNREVFEEEEEGSLVDFEFLKQSLSRNQLNVQKIFTNDNKKLIHNLAKIYHVDDIYLEKAILWSINDKMELLRDELHEACKDYYAKNFQPSAPKLQPKQERPQEDTSEKSPKTKEDKLILHFERITHREILEDFSQTGHASEQEVKMLTNVMFRHGLPQSVMNVLVHYVMQKSDMKLTRNYVDKIATHWSRKNVKTVKQAMDLAKSESKLYQTWGTRKGAPKKKEVLPDWFKKEQQPKQEQKPANSNNQDYLKEKQELEQALKNMTTKSFNR